MTANSLWIDAQPRTGVVHRLIGVDENLQEGRLIESLSASSNAFVGLLTHRHSLARRVRTQWSGNQRDALRHLMESSKEADAGPLVDFLTAMQSQRLKERLCIDAVSDLLELVLFVLHIPEGSVSLVLLALRTLRYLNTRFRSRLEEGLRRGGRVLGTTEGSLDCNASLDLLKDSAAVVSALSARKDTAGEEARRLVLELPSH